MGIIQIYSWVINCGSALSYSYFMGRKDNNLISFPLCLSVCVCVCFSLNMQYEVQSV